jgi:hypothetical protein
MCIYKLRLTVSETEIRRLLERYFGILETSDKTQQEAELQKFRVEMKDKLNQDGSVRTSKSGTTGNDGTATSIQP